jgi:molecular chaperone Hsp33
MTSDYAAFALAAGDSVRIVAARTTDLVREAQMRHDCSPTVTAALGRLLTGAALIGSSSSDHERITLQVDADGPVRGLVAEVRRGGRVRGYPGRPRADVPLTPAGKFDVGGVVGRGFLNVTRIYETGQPYTSAVPLQTGEIGEDLAYFFANSEQIPSVVAVGVLANPQGVLAAGGILAQLLPGADASVTGVLERAARAIPQVSTLVRRGLSPEQMVDELAGELEPRVMHVQPLVFACRCNRDRVTKVILGLGRADLTLLGQAQEDTEVRCDFCGQLYHFSPSEIRELLASAGEAAM